jgi:hypothetical protein
MENQIETPSQTIKSILEIIEAFGVSEKAVSIVRKKCWHLSDNDPEVKVKVKVKVKGNGNGLDKNISNTNKSPQII